MCDRGDVSHEDVCCHGLTMEEDAVHEERGQHVCVCGGFGVLYIHDEQAEGNDDDCRRRRCVELHLTGTETTVKQIQWAIFRNFYMMDGL